MQATAAPQPRHAVHDLKEAAAKARVHVTVNDGIVAAVRHGKPVEREPDVRQRLPVGEPVVVEQQLQ